MRPLHGVQQHRGLAGGRGSGVRREGGGRIYYPYGGGAFSLTPYRCSVMAADDDRVNFRLDLDEAADTIADLAYHLPKRIFRLEGGSPS